jgi:hypothetical protein
MLVVSDYTRLWRMSISRRVGVIYHWIVIVTTQRVHRRHTRHLCHVHDHVPIHRWLSHHMSNTRVYCTHTHAYCIVGIMRWCVLERSCYVCATRWRRRMPIWGDGTTRLGVDMMRWVFGDYIIQLIIIYIQTVQHFRTSTTPSVRHESEHIHMPESSSSAALTSSLHSVIEQTRADSPLK